MIGKKLASTILKDAKHLLQTTSWTGAEASEARDEHGKVCQATHYSARSFTPHGAVKKMGLPNASWSDALGWLRLEARDRFGCGGLYEFNIAPGRTFEEVIQLFDYAIARAERWEAMPPKG